VYQYLLASLLFLTAFTVACGCERPERWKDAALTGCFAAGDHECCSYDDGRCIYTVCADYAGFACEYEQTSFWCG